jgi:hypothetical protein
MEHLSKHFHSFGLKKKLLSTALSTGTIPNAEVEICLLLLTSSNFEFALFTSLMQGAWFSGLKNIVHYFVIR